MHIFLSYASEQKSIAEPIAFSLRARGHHVFLDKDDLPPGRSYDEQIKQAVEQSDVMIYLVSPASVAQGRYTRTELEFARAAWRHPANRVLPVMIEPTPMSDVPSFLKGVTILEPHGNVTAEVGAAVEQLRGTDAALLSAAMATAIVAAGILALVGLMHVSISAFFANPMATLQLSVGFPFALLLWLMGRRRRLLFLAPLVTMAFAAFVIHETSTITDFKGFDVDVLRTTSTTSTPNPATQDSIDASEPSPRDIEIERIERWNENMESVVDAAVISSIFLIAAFAGSAFLVPEIHSVGRWVASLAFTAVAASIANIALSAVGPASWFVIIYLFAIFLPIAAALGYWMGRGRAA